MPRIIADSELRTKKFEQGADRLKRIGSETARNLSRSFASVVGIGALTGMLATAGRQFDRVGKLAKRFSVAAEDLQRIGFAAEQSGASLEDVARGMNRFTKSLAEAQDGSEAKRRALDELGLSLVALAGMSPAAQFAALAEAVANAKDEGRTLALVMELLGRSGAELMPTLQEGAAGLRELGDEIQIVDGEDVARIERFNDALNRMKTNLIAMAAGPLAKVVEIFEGAREALELTRVRADAFGKAMEEGASLQESISAADAAQSKFLRAPMLREGIEENSARLDASNPALLQGGRLSPDDARRKRMREVFSDLENDPFIAPEIDVPGMGMGLWGALLGAAMAGTGATATARHGREVSDAETRHESLRDLLEAMRGAGGELGQFRAMGSNELNPYAAAQREATAAIRTAVEESARHLQELVDRDPLAVFASFDG